MFRVLAVLSSVVCLPNCYHCWADSCFARKWGAVRTPHTHAEPLSLNAGDIRALDKWPAFLGFQVQLKTVSNTGFRV